MVQNETLLCPQCSCLSTQTACTVSNGIKINSHHKNVHCTRLHHVCAALSSKLGRPHHVIKLMTQQTARLQVNCILWHYTFNLQVWLSSCVACTILSKYWHHLVETCNSFLSYSWACWVGKITCKNPQTFELSSSIILHQGHTYGHASHVGIWLAVVLI